MDEQTRQTSCDSIVHNVKKYHRAGNANVSVAVHFSAETNDVIFKRKPTNHMSMSTPRALSNEG